MLERRPEERLVREEHHDELRGCVELPPVRLLAELDDVVAHLAGVVTQRNLSRVVRDLGGERVQIGGERRLGVDDDALATREADEDVGAQHAPVAVVRRRLLDEVAVLDHPRELHHPSELDLAPSPANVRCTESGDEVARLAPQPQLVLAQASDGLRQRAVGLLPCALERGHLRLDLSERLAKRRDVRVELRLGEIEEGARALLHRSGRGCPHCAGDALVERPTFRGELRLCLDRAPLVAPRLDLELVRPPQRLRRGLQPLAEREESPCHSQREPGNQTDEQCDDRHEDQAT